MDDSNVLNDTQEGNVDPQNTDTGTGESTVNTDSALAEQKPAQTHEENALAKQVRITAESKARDELIAEIYGGQGIKTYAEYQELVLKQKAAEEAAQLNLSPEVYERISKTEKIAQEAFEKLSQYERKELLEKQAETISKDAKWGKFFKDNEGDIKGLAQKLNTDLDTAKLLILEQKYQEPDLESVKKTAVQDYLDKLKNGYKPVEGSGNTPVTQAETPKTFEEARKQSMAYLRETKQF